MLVCCTLTFRNGNGCSRNFWCDRNALRCWPKRPIGAQCNEDYKCLSENCEGQKCTAADVMCTLDVKQCPDGSFVGRVPPGCNFEECPTDVACNRDAKVCPDGSSVSRVPPSCEFAKCPALACNNDRDCPTNYICAEPSNVCILVTGKLPNGAECISNEQCQSGFCDKNFLEISPLEDANTESSNTNNPDICRPKKANGVGCDFDFECISDLCLDFECSGCRTDADCPSDSFCDSKSCKKKLSNGKDCTANNQCLSGFCDKDFLEIMQEGDANTESSNTNNPDICRPKKADGEGCDDNFECISNMCVDFECTSKLPVGEDCDSNSDCMSNACSCVTNKCIVLRAAGGACGDTCECRAGLWCHDNVCEAKGGLSDHCHNTADCQENLQCDVFPCQWGLCGTETCVTEDGEGRVGQYCVRDRHCRSNRCRGPTGNRSCRSNSRSWSDLLSSWFNF